MPDRFTRDLMRGSLEMMVLSTLADGRKYGYLIQTRIRQVSASQVALPAGTLYPMLHRLESKKLIRSRWEDKSGRRRKWYDLTAAGRRSLDQQVGQWQQYVDCVRQLIAPDDAAPQPA